VNISNDRFPRVEAWALALFGVLFVAAAWLYVAKVSGKMPDLDVYLRAGARAAAAEPLYRAEDEHFQFKYLPAFALLVSPLSAIDAPAARALWFALSVACLGGLLYMSVRLPATAVVRSVPLAAVKPGWVLAAVAVVVLGKFYARELVLGQVNLMFAAAIAAALLALERGREGQAGVLIALGIVLKPYGALFLPWLLARRRSASAIAAFTGLAVALLAPSALYGVTGNIALHREWWSTVLTTTAPNLSNPDNVSWLAMYARWFGDGAGPWPLALLLVTVVCGIGLAAWVWSRRRHVAFPEGLEGALLLVVIPFLSPQGWDYVLLLATPAVVYVVACEVRLPPVVRWITFAALVTIGTTIYDLMGRTAYHAFMNASGITLCFFVVIAALLVLRWRAVA